MNEAHRKAAGALQAKAARTLEAAQSVVENGFFDDASSRAYYAAFHAASAALAGRGLFFSSPREWIPGACAPSVGRSVLRIRARMSSRPGIDGAHHR